MARTTARAAVMQMIFEHMAGGEGGEETLQMVYEALRKEGLPGVDRISENEPSESDRAYITEVLDGVLAHLDELDEAIQAASPRWEISRMPHVDLTILRMAAWEILYEEGIPGRHQRGSQPRQPLLRADERPLRQRRTGYDSAQKAGGKPVKRVVVGLDTSCYTTSAAAVTAEGNVIASCRKLLPVPQGQRGLRQSEAVFTHVRQLPGLIEELSAYLTDCEIVAVCASRRPRDEEASYMPVFQAGDAQGRSLAALLRVPCFATTHQRGHVEAAKVDSGVAAGDLLAVHLSGGTTEVLSLVDDRLTLLGGTLDLHAGQVVDRTGVALGLPFPAGPHLEELAVRGTARALLPVAMADGGLYCHLSGAETQVQRWIAQGMMPKEDIAREVYDLLARTVSRMVTAASQQTGIRQVLIAGGVASSRLFRELVTQRTAKRQPDLRVRFGRPEYSGDNAVGVALIGARKWREQQALKEIEYGSTDTGR